MGQLALFDLEAGELQPVGGDHALLALIPFALGSRRDDPREPVTLSYRCDLDGRQRRVNVTLGPDASVGMPRPTDQVILLALLQLGLRGTFGRRLEFHRTELLDLLGTVDNNFYGQLKHALARLTGLTVTINDRAYSRSGREYDRQQGGHLIDAYRISDEYNGVCWIEWGHYVMEAATLDDFKRLDWSRLLRLGNPMSMQLYRLLDRVALSGQTTWAIGWRALAVAVGVNADAYARPARFKQVLQPHVESLLSEGVLLDWDYGRGGEFTFHLSNRLRAGIRRALEELGVYPDLARQLLVAHDEAELLAWLDAVRRGARQPAKPAAYLAVALKEGYEPAWPVDDMECFVGILGLFSAAEVEAAAKLTVRLYGEPLGPDPLHWPGRARGICRALLADCTDVL